MIWGIPLFPCCCIFLGDFSAQGSVHITADNVVVGEVGLKEHQFGDSTFYGTVVSADDSGFLELVSGVVASHLYAAGNALADVDDGDAAAYCVVEQADEPRTLRGIAAAETTHDDAAQFGCFEHVAHDAFLYAGEEGEHHNVLVHARVRNHGLAEVRLQDVVGAEGEGHARLAEVGIVEGGEGIEAVSVLLGATIAADELSAEIDAYLGYHSVSVRPFGGGNLYAGHQILLAVGAELSHRQLTSGENHRFGEILQHERQCRGRVRHGVGTVQNDKPVVLVIPLGNDAYQLGPHSRADVAGVYRLGELIGVDIRLQIRKLRHIVDEVVEVQWFEGTRIGVDSHTDGTAGIDQQYFVGGVHSRGILHIFRSCLCGKINEKM